MRSFSPDGTGSDSAIYPTFTLVPKHGRSVALAPCAVPRPTEDGAKDQTLLPPQTRGRRVRVS